ncbi:MAG: DUF1467 family protein [Bdellovibrionales bacterium]
MSLFSAVVVYILIWWMVLFCTLPFGVRHSEKPEGGNMPGAPADPGLRKKLIITTVVSTLLWVAAYFVITSNLISFREIAERMAR